MANTVGGRYVLDGRLGEGGMGQVFRARHLQLGTAFALKVISPAFALDPDARARFHLEAKLASEISHPNIVSVIDFGEDPALGAYMVMDLVEGEQLIDGGVPMTIRRVCDVLAQIADALDHIHERGIIHGDVKADNIMLTTETTGARRRRVARLLDFGLARRPDSGEEAQEVSGSPHYLAPERAAGGAPSVSADIYALGVLGYLMITGSLPFDGNVVEILMAHINKAPERLSVRRQAPVDDALETLISRAMAKDPANRHASVAAFRGELDAAMDMLSLGRRRTPSGTSPDPKSS
jgi:serine/threonine protein kinase